MDQAMQLWTWWLSLLSPFALIFTRPGWVRFVPWVTGMVLCWEEHTMTQLLTALGLESRWRVLEHCAEYGAGDRDAVERPQAPSGVVTRPWRPTIPAAGCRARGGPGSRDALPGPPGGGPIIRWRSTIPSGTGPAPRFGGPAPFMKPAPAVRIGPRQSGPTIGW